MMRGIAMMLVLGSGCQAVAATPLCPPLLLTIETAQPSVGFKSYADGNPPVADVSATGRFPLLRAMFSEGPPEQSGWLVPDRGDANTQTWNFAAGRDHDVWISCVYTGTTLMMSKALVATIGICRVSRLNIRQGPAIDCH